MRAARSRPAGVRLVAVSRAVAWREAARRGGSWRRRTGVRGAGVAWPSLGDRVGWATILLRRTAATSAVVRRRDRLVAEAGLDRQARIARETRIRAGAGA